MSNSVQIKKIPGVVYDNPIHYTLEEFIEHFKNHN